MVRSLRSYVIAAYPCWLEEKLNETPDGGKFAVAILLHWYNANFHAYDNLSSVSKWWKPANALADLPCVGTVPAVVAYVQCGDCCRSSFGCGWFQKPLVMWLRLKSLVVWLKPKTLSVGKRPLMLQSVCHCRVAVKSGDGWGIFFVTELWNPLLVARKECH